MRIIFFGTSQFAVPALKTLVGTKHDIMGVITQPDKPTGRKQTLSPSPVKILAEQHNIKVLQPKTLKDDSVFEEFESLNPDMCVIASYGKIIPKRFLDAPKHGFINIHPSLLPKYRGPSPIQTAILNGDTKTGVAIMVVDEDIDHGPILNSIEYKVSSIKYYEEIQNDLSKLGAELLIETLPKYINGDIEPIEQDHDQATFTKMFSREDGRIDWDKPAQEIHNQIRALNPEPGTWTTWHPSTGSGQASKVINIFSITTSDVVSPQVGEIDEIPGTVKKLGGDIVVAAESGYLILESVQLEGGKKMNIKDFINGHQDFTNSTLK